MAAPERLQRTHLQSGIHALPLTLDALAVFDAIIDVRSPSEFAIDHIPGAINHPVLNDDERIHVGTIYKQLSAFD